MRRVVAILAASCSAPASPKPPDMLKPPVAARHPHVVTSPNGDREDPYYWLRDDKRDDPAVLAYLRAENEYTASAMAPMAEIEKQIFDEQRARLVPDDGTVPVFDDGYYSYEKYVPDHDFPIYVRRKGSADAPEEIILDGNALANGHEFFAIATYAVSHDGRYLAWADDIVGRRQFTLHIKDLTTGATLPDTATNISDSLVWANDNRTLFYVGKDAKTLREDRVLAHRVGESTDREVFREPDESFFVSVRGTKSHKYVQIFLDAETKNEVELIDADHPDAAPRVVLPREPNQLYDLDHVDGKFVIRTNDHAPNFRVVTVADGQERDKSKWHDVIAANADRLVEWCAAYRTFVAATVREGGMRKVLVASSDKAPYFLPSAEPVSTMEVKDTPGPDATKLRYTYRSNVTPDITYELDVATGKHITLKQMHVPGYDPTKYQAVYLHATASDGAQIPISVVYRKDTKLDGTAPMHVYGYGAHGISNNINFGLWRLPMLDRGWVLAVAHVRGGQELGRAWYESGKLMHKMNTFTDFIAVTEYLVAHKYGARDQVFAEGGSSGGILMGAIANMRPDLYRGIISKVPFVDVVTTMLDESIPLTTNEYDEWGNPKDKAAYDYMLSYSPYDNIKPQGYPSIYVKTGFWDSQVQYYEPAKWVAKLRATKTDANLVMLDVDMTSGHTRKVGRFDSLKEDVRLFSFMLMISKRPDARAKR